MPLINYSKYKPFFILKNSHIQTVFSKYFRKTMKVQYLRERIATQDDDFLDIDWSKVNSRKIALIIHGLEGSSKEKNVIGLIRAFNKRSWDCAGMNLRGAAGKSIEKFIFTIPEK